MKQFDELGREIPDPTPVPHNSQVTRMGNIMSALSQFIQTELSRQAHDQGMDTEEEANDFDLDEEGEDTWTAYEEEDYLASSPAEPTPSNDGTAPGDATPVETSTTPAGSAAPAATA